MKPHPSAGLFFESARPAALTLPHLITALDAELIGKVTQLTEAKPGLWNLPAPFDENDRFDNLRESAPLSAWAQPLNQSEVQAFGPRVREAVFGAKLMFVDSMADERVLGQKAVLAARRLDTGACVTESYQDLPALPEILERIGWALIPIGPERSRALFITESRRADLVAKLREWCEREGRNFATVSLNAGALEFVDQPAPAKYRDNAITHHIDGLLGTIEIYFGGVDETLLPVIEQRIRTRRKLRQDIARSKHSPPPV